MDNRYTLPNLPYDYAALEPHYSAKLLKLHHDKHHAATGTSQIYRSSKIGCPEPLTHYTKV